MLASIYIDYYPIWNIDTIGKLSISYSRAIDIQALVGNVGGYIGLCLGYSILQIPDFVLFILYKVKMYISRSRKATIKMDLRNSFMPKQGNWESVKPNNDSISLSIDERSMISEIIEDNFKILATVQKQEQRIKSLEKKIDIA